MAAGIARHVPGEADHVLGPFGPGADQAHLAAQHVDELRQLVERGAPEPSSNRRAAIVVLHPAGCGARRGREPLRLRAPFPHRAELEHREFLAVPPDSALAIKEGTRRAHLHQEGDGDQHRAQQDQQQHRADTVEHVLHREAGAARIHAAKLLERK
jgi:hypothetical protein